MSCECWFNGTARTKRIRGQPVTIRDSTEWGSEEGQPPHDGICTISDANRVDVWDLMAVHSIIENGEESGEGGPRFVIKQSEVQGAKGATFTEVQFRAIFEETAAP